jgi:Arc/MetJ family transcription regulator
LWRTGERDIIFPENDITKKQALWRLKMSRTVIDIENDLLKKAQRLTGMSKKVDVVNYALKRLVEQKAIEKVLDLKGKVRWEGSLEEMRRGRSCAR